MQWGYHANDSLAWMKLPGDDYGNLGETLEFTSSSSLD
jgi:hypothetical protein